MYKVYQNKYFNNLMLNIIKVSSCPNATIDTQDYYLALNNANRQYDNKNITLKVILYLCSILNDDGLNNNTHIIKTDDIKTDLNLTNLTLFNASLDYISSVTFNYKLDKINKWCYVDKIITNYTHNKGYYKITFSDEFIILLNRTKQYYQIPKELLKSDIRYYRHSIFMANYILLHQRRNMRQDKEKNKNTISVNKLLANCPLLPLYDELDREQRQVNRAIIKPFENNLNKACKILGKQWAYKDKEPSTYLDFLKAKITIS